MREKTDALLRHKIHFYSYFVLSRGSREVFNFPEEEGASATDDEQTQAGHKDVFWFSCPVVQACARLPTWSWAALPTGSCTEVCHCIFGTKTANHLVKGGWQSQHHHWPGFFGCVSPTLPSLVGPLLPFPSLSMCESAIWVHTQLHLRSHCGGLENKALQNPRATCAARDNECKWHKRLQK